MHAIEAYFKMVNDAGGVDGHKLVLLEKDDGYSPAAELVVVKSLISDDHVPLIFGLGQSSGFGSILPVLTQTKTIGFMTQATLKDASYPFQPYIFEGNCNYSDQGDVAPRLRDEAPQPEEPERRQGRDRVDQRRLGNRVGPEPDRPRPGARRHGRPRDAALDGSPTRRSRCRT